MLTQMVIKLTVILAGVTIMSNMLSVIMPNVIVRIVVAPLRMFRLVLKKIS